MRVKSTSKEMANALPKPSELPLAGGKPDDLSFKNMTIPALQMPTIPTQTAKKCKYCKKTTPVMI